MRSSIRKAWCLVAGVVLLLPIGAAAQSIQMTNDDILIENAGGTTVGSWINGDDINLGALGAGDGDLNLRNGTSGLLAITLDGTTADAVFGGGNQDGDIILRDTDGTTTTISLDGQLGFIQLGSPNEDGDLRLFDNSPDNSLSINLDGATGNVSNQLVGNGLVKAWARINSNGTVASCYNCSSSAFNTQRLSTGDYEVDFTFATNISSRPWVCSVGHGGNSTIVRHDTIGCAGRNGDPSSVYVAIENHAGTDVDREFTLVVF